MQTGIHLDNGICGFWNMPEYVVLINDTLYPVDKEHCRSHNNFYICQSMAISGTPSCIQGTYNKCLVADKQCPNSCSVVMNEEGVMIRDNDRNDRFNYSSHDTYFLKWEDTNSTSEICGTTVKRNDYMITDQETFKFRPYIVDGMVTSNLLLPVITSNQYYAEREPVPGPHARTVIYQPCCTKT